MTLAKIDKYDNLLLEHVNTCEGDLKYTQVKK